MTALLRLLLLWGFFYCLCVCAFVYVRAHTVAALLLLLLLLLFLLLSVYLHFNVCPFAKRLPVAAALLQRCLSIC